MLPSWLNASGVVRWCTPLPGEMTHTQIGKRGEIASGSLCNLMVTAGKSVSLNPALAALITICSNISYDIGTMTRIP